MENHKIESVTVENFLRVKFAEIRFDENGVCIGGENRAGKSSIAKAILMAFVGKVGVPADPVHHGAEEARVTVELDGDLILKARVKPNRDYEIQLCDKDGGIVRKPQDRLNEFNARYSFAPQDFMDLGRKEQVDLLMALAGIDFGKVERQRDAAYQERERINRDGKQKAGALAGKVKHEGVPETEVSMTDALAELGAAEDLKKSAEQLFLRSNEATLSANRILNEISDQEQKILELRKQIQAAEYRIEKGKAEREGYEATARELDEKAKAVVVPDIAGLKKSLSEIEGTNRKVRENQEYAKLESEVVSLREQSQAQTDRISNVDAQKKKMIEDAEFPVPGLGFNEHGVTLGGVPFDQGSEAEQWQAALGIGIALKPKLRLVYCRNGGAMTPATRGVLREFCQSKGFQLLFEIPGDGPDAAVIMEDGEVREDRREAKGESDGTNGTTEGNPEAAASAEPAAA